MRFRRNVPWPVTVWSIVSTSTPPPSGAPSLPDCVLRHLAFRQSISTTIWVVPSTVQFARCRSITRRVRSVRFSAPTAPRSRSAIGAGGQFVDLGAGDCTKGESWLPFVAAKRYVAVDIAAGVHRTGPRAACRPLFRGWRCWESSRISLAGSTCVADLGELSTTFFYPGSSIGNFTPDEALLFLQAIHRHCEVPGSGLLIGVDTIKDKARLDAAYDDSLGVTAAFNRNVLNHVNRVLGSDFEATAYAHRGFYNKEARRIEMHLEAMSTQVVTLDGAPRIFARGRAHPHGEFVQVCPEDFAARLEQAGFRVVHCWQDARGDFAVFHAT